MNLEAKSAEKPQYTHKILDLATSPKHRGAYFQEDAMDRGMALVEGKYKDLKVYWLVQPENDEVYSAKFFAYGGTLSLAIGEILCTLIEGRVFTNPNVISLEEVERLMRDEENTPYIPPEELSEKLIAVPEILKETRQRYPDSKKLTEASKAVKKLQKDPRNFSSLSEAGKQWMDLAKEKQLEKIEAIIDADIRPGLNMDGGDITIMDLEDGYKIKVNWEGACGGCASSAGATLSFLEDKLRKEIFEGLTVESESMF